MFDLGMQELIVIFVIILIVFGPQRLPELARTLGKGLGEVKRAVQGVKEKIDEEVDEIKKPIEEIKKPFEEIKEPLGERISLFDTTPGKVTKENDKKVEESKEKLIHEKKDINNEKKEKKAKKQLEGDTGKAST